MAVSVLVITDRKTAATERAETMLAIAEFVGVFLDQMNEVRVHLAQHEAMFDAAVESSRRKALAQLIARDVAELAAAYKMMARAVERGGEA